MPEYLAPGVYVEEIDTGSKPIEGVSTSTTGVVGVTERGPLNVPVLVTSTGEFTRLFGGRLDPGAFEGHQYLPYAVEGFFTNGGRRAYVVRVAGDGATKASSDLYYAEEGAAPTVLVRPSAEGTGSAATQPSLVVLEPTGLAKDDWVRIGDGSAAEHHRVAGSLDDDRSLVALVPPLALPHPAGESVIAYKLDASDVYALDQLAPAGALTITLVARTAKIEELVSDLENPATPAAWLKIGDPPKAKGSEGPKGYCVTAWEPAGKEGTNSKLNITLDYPLAQQGSAGATVARAEFTPCSGDPTVSLATVGGGLLFVDDSNDPIPAEAELALVGGELRRVGKLTQLDIVQPSVGHEAGQLIEAVTLPDARKLAAEVKAGEPVLLLNPGEAAGLARGQRIAVGSTDSLSIHTIVEVDLVPDKVTVQPAASGVAAGATVVPLAKETRGDTTAGAKVLALDDRLGLAVGSVLSIGGQFVTVESLPGLTGVAPDAGNVVVWPALSAAIPAKTKVDLPRTPIPEAAPSSVALDARGGADVLYVSTVASFASGKLIRVTAGDRAAYYTLAQNAAAATVKKLTLDAPLRRSHPAGAIAVKRAQLFSVEALDVGAWGDRIRVSVQDEPSGLVASTSLKDIVSATSIRLDSAAGVQVGTILELLDPVTRAPLGDPVKVDAIDRGNQYTITLADKGLTAAQQLRGAVVRSREFRLTVRLLRQPDPAVPSRDQQAIDVETFRHLSLDPRHSNYIETIIGKAQRDGDPVRKWDRRPEGASLYIRVLDLAGDAAKSAPRLGPEALVDVLPDGRRVPAQHRLEVARGDDAIVTVGTDAYLGADNADPELRTGLQSLRNVEQVSLVAIPGQVSPALQQGVIDHCELMRYRFAVLDTRPEPDDTISDAQTQRQQFDTKYAALYYPWLAIPEPFPSNLADVHDCAIPPSGHVLGVFVRTDVTRGVHKAPANEVVRGITGLRRKINRAEHDILNPYPTNINVIRDFREDGRGIRVFGGRVLTSDPDWKYVNVRRLLIFIEASLDRGLQWVVFEPNADPLWARVRRVVSNFLTGVWRDGALEGTKPEEAFFVRCDRTTMTQTDIDNGRLIVQIGVAPVKPAEFVILRIGLWTAHADS